MLDRAFALLLASQWRVVFDLGLFCIYMRAVNNLFTRGPLGFATYQTSRL